MILHAVQIASFSSVYTNTCSPSTLLKILQDFKVVLRNSSPKLLALYSWKKVFNDSGFNALSIHCANVFSNTLLVCVNIASINKILEI